MIPRHTKTDQQSGHGRFDRRPRLDGKLPFLLLPARSTSIGPADPEGLSGSLDFGACLIIPVAGATVCVLALDYFGRSVAVRTDRARALLDRGERTQGRGWRWSVLPLFLTLILSVHLWSWPLRGRFHLSRPAFARAVQQIQSGADPKTLQGWIGLYEVHDISDWGTGVIFFRTGWLGWFDPVGFVYRPSDTPRSRGDERLARFWFTKTE